MKRFMGIARGLADVKQVSSFAALFLADFLSSFVILCAGSFWREMEFLGSGVT
jgi:hypothetical protein